MRINSIIHRRTRAYTRLTSEEIDASGVGDVRRYMAGTHVKSGFDVCLLDFANFVLGIGLGVGLRTAPLLPLSLFVLVPLGRNGAFDLNGDNTIETEKKKVTKKPISLTEFRHQIRSGDLPAYLSQNCA